MLRKGQLTSDPGVGGGELGLDDCTIGLCRLQFGGKVLRPDSLLGIILPSFVLLSKELANVLLRALRNTRKRGVPPSWRNQKRHHHFTEKRQRN